MPTRLRLWHLAGLAALVFIAGCGDQPTLVKGNVTFEPQPASVDGKTLYIYVIQDPSGEAGVLERLDQQISGEPPRVHFELTGDDPPAGDYVLRAHLDLDDDGQANPGDYQSPDVPIFRGNYPERVSVRLTPIE